MRRQTWFWWKGDAKWSVSPDPKGQGDPETPLLRWLHTHSEEVDYLQQTAFKSRDEGRLAQLSPHCSVASREKKTVLHRYDCLKKYPNRTRVSTLQSFLQSQAINLGHSYVLTQLWWILQCLVIWEGSGPSPSSNSPNTPCSHSVLREPTLQMKQQNKSLCPRVWVAKPFPVTFPKPSCWAKSYFFVRKVW